MSCSISCRSRWNRHISSTSVLRRPVWPTVLGIAVSVLAVWWVLRDVHWADVRSHVTSAELLPLGAAVVVATSTFVLRFLRWRVLLRAEDGSALPAAPLWHAVAIGFMANNILPFRMGEVIRSVTVTRLAPVRLTAALSSVAVERVFDGLTVVGLLAVSLLAAGLPADVEIGGVSVAHIAAVGGAAMLAALLGALAIVAWPAPAERLIRRIVPSAALADRIVRLVDGLRHGLSVLRSPGRVMAVIAWSLVIWLVNALSFYLAFKAFGISANFAGALLLQGVLVFGIAVPSTPGYVGVFESAIKAVLLVLGVSADRAVAYGVTYHATTFLPIVLLGVWSLLTTSIRLRDLREAPPT